MRKAITFSLFPVLIFALSAVLLAQAKKTKKVVKPVAAAPAVPQPTPDISVATPPKKNERPGGESTTASKKNEGRSQTAAAVDPPVYFYEFTRPGFVYSRVLIEHGENGKGKISLQKDGYDELFTDPIDLSEVTLARIKGALANLNFLDSTESYQFTGHDFSNMGNIQFTVKKGGRERTVKYNWTENKDARLLMDEYRYISNEAIWKFDISIAMVNQPLLTPGLMDAVDAYLQRNEISDPPHLLPFLNQLTSDERLPLMARNHATKLIKQIEKTKK